MAAKQKVPIFDSIAKALTLGGTSVAEDGVLSVGPSPNSRLRP